MAKRTNDNLRSWALIGAEQRLVQLAAEAAAIHRTFPELRQGRGGRGGAVAAAAPAGAGTAGRGRRRRRRMSADARRRISEAQKARWARQRAAGSTKKR